MMELVTDLLIYIGIGTITFVIGMILGYQVLMIKYKKRFMIIAQQCSDSDSVIPIIDEIAQET
ncbi:MAG: hypothetical protein NTY71_06280 [Methanoregula sp.]|jgi:hypothetical protein|nr:hypothetical protein [Methanoregula sp.]